jgi:hypothetical protein
LRSCRAHDYGGFVLTAAGQQAPAAASLVNSHAFWYGILLACLIAWIVPDLALIVLFAVALFASGLFQTSWRNVLGISRWF